MCPYKEYSCPACHVGNSYPSCARYQYVTIKDAQSIPDGLGVLDYAKIPNVLCKPILTNIKTDDSYYK